MSVQLTFSRKAVNRSPWRETESAKADWLEWQWCGGVGMLQVQCQIIVKYPPGKLAHIQVQGNGKSLLAGLWLCWAFGTQMQSWAFLRVGFKHKTTSGLTPQLARTFSQKQNFRGQRARLVQMETFLGLWHLMDLGFVLVLEVVQSTCCVPWPK